jgi:hypothetical protein
VVSLGTGQDDHPTSAPTAEHNILAADEGTWDATIKAYPNGSDYAPMVSKGVEINTVLWGGLWVVSTFRSDFAGMAFEERGQFGYDPAQKKYVVTWIDSMSPSLNVLEGSYDAKTRTLTYTCDGVCPGDGSKLAKKRVTTTKQDGGREFALSVMGAPTGGQEAKVM